MDTVNQTALDAFRSSITHVLPSQVRHCIEQLSEDQLWWRPNESSNSVGNLALHLSGSTRYHLSNAIGGIEYTRNRPQEFAERGPVAKEELLATFDETIRQAKEVLNSLDAARITDSVSLPDSGQNVVIFNMMFKVAMHLAMHAGQVLYVTKMLKEGSVDEIWMKVNK